MDGDAEAVPQTEPGLSRSTIVRRRILALTVLLVLLAAGLLHRTDRVVRADGRLAPKRWAEIRADGPGDVRTRLKHRGDRVQTNEAVALLALEGEESAVAAARDDLAVARRQFETVSSQLSRMAEHSVLVPPPSVLDLGTWLEDEVHRRASATTLAARATARLRSIRSELQARAERIQSSASNPAKHAAPPMDRALESRLARGETQMVSAIRFALDSGTLPLLDQAMTRYEDSIFEGLCDLAHVPPPVVRDEFAAGYFELQSEFRRTQFELRQLETEAASLARLREVFPALAGERHGELKALRKALEELVARSQQLRQRRDDGLGPDGERLRAEIHRNGEELLEGVESAWARIDESSGSGLGALEHQISQLRMGFSTLEWALDRQLAAISSHSQGLIGRNALEEQSASAEQQANLFLDSAERVKIVAQELLGKRVGEVEFAIMQKRGALEIARTRLRQSMAAADLANDHPTLETTRARCASTVVRAEWALKAAKLALETKVVRAPMDGVITSLGLQERTTLARNEVVGVIEDLDGMVFKALIPERELPGVAEGQRVRLSIDVDHQAEAVEGRVSWVGRGGVVLEKEQLPWNVLVAVEGASADLMPSFLGRAQIVVGKESGFERLKQLLRRSPPTARRYLNPELPDPTRVLPLRPESTPPGEDRDQLQAVETLPDSLATSLTRLVDRRGH
jgi:HlyD family secretion protein